MKSKSNATNVQIIYIERAASLSKHLVLLFKVTICVLYFARESLLCAVKWTSANGATGVENILVGPSRLFTCQSSKCNLYRFTMVKWGTKRRSDYLYFLSTSLNAYWNGLLLYSLRLLIRARIFKHCDEPT